MYTTVQYVLNLTLIYTTLVHLICLNGMHKLRLF